SKPLQIQRNYIECFVPKRIKDTCIEWKLYNDLRLHDIIMHHTESVNFEFKNISDFHVWLAQEEGQYNVQYCKVKGIKSST
ncbi:hypothetical protein NQ317_003432, partial [Molorchus minor]